MKNCVREVNDYGGGKTGKVVKGAGMQEWRKEGKVGGNNRREEQHFGRIGRNIRLEGRRRHVGTRKERNRGIKECRVIVLDRHPVK